MTDFLVLDFKTEYANGKATDYVLLAPKGEALERTKTWHAVKHITPPKDMDPDRASTPTMVDMVERWKTIGPAYAAFQQGQDIPETGTPLAAWAGIQPEQASLLRRMGIKTVEDVAAMSESTAIKLPFPNARKLAPLAAEYLASRDKVDQALEMDAMREKMLAMEEMLAEALKPEKRGPGRPKKDEAEAA